MGRKIERKARQDRILRNTSVSKTNRERKKRELEQKEKENKGRKRIGTVSKTESQR